MVNISKELKSLVCRDGYKVGNAREVDMDTAGQVIIKELLNNVIYYNGGVFYPGMILFAGQTDTIINSIGRTSFKQPALAVTNLGGGNGIKLYFPFEYSDVLRGLDDCHTVSIPMRSGYYFDMKITPADITYERGTNNNLRLAITPREDEMHEVSINIEVLDKAGIYYIPNSRND